MSDLYSLTPQQKFISVQMGTDWQFIENAAKQGSPLINWDGLFVSHLKNELAKTLKAGYSELYWLGHAFEIKGMISVTLDPDGVSGDAQLSNKGFIYKAHFMLVGNCHNLQFFVDNGGQKGHWVKTDEFGNEVPNEF